MSVSEKITMKCPGCGAEQSATVWKSLDSTSDPAIREALFAWEINVFVCGECDFRAQLPVGLRYSDSSKRFSVQYYPLDALGHDEFYANFRQDGEPIEDEEESGIKPHIVFDMAEMMRYIAFREIVFEKGVSP
ncbi:MAG TPA: CpXC domain-containing protein [Methanocella sp.]|jgi:hypothetical protein